MCNYWVTDNAPKGAKHETSDMQIRETVSGRRLSISGASCPHTLTTLTFGLKFKPVPLDLAAISELLGVKKGFQI